MAELDIDAVLCISIKDRDDRRALLQKEFAETGLEIEFVLVDRDGNDPQRGCFTSHQTCARLIIDRGYRHALILEDDATLDEWNSATLQRVNHFIDTKKPDILFLGVILGKMWLTWFPSIARCRAVGAHAYILSVEGARRTLEHTYTDLGIDTLQKKIFRQYCVFPMICHQQSQDVSRSDIAKTPYAKGEDSKIWQRNREKQHKQVMKNFWKTLLHYDQ